MAQETTDPEVTRTLRSLHEQIGNADLRMHESAAALGGRLDQLRELSKVMTPRFIRGRQFTDEECGVMFAAAVFAESWLRTAILEAERARVIAEAVDAGKAPPSLIDEERRRIAERIW